MAEWLAYTGLTLLLMTVFGLILDQKKKRVYWKALEINQKQTETEGDTTF